MKKHRSKCKQSKRDAWLNIIICRDCGAFWFSNNAEKKERLLQIKRTDCGEILARRTTKRILFGKSFEERLLELHTCW